MSELYLKCDGCKSPLYNTNLDQKDVIEIKINDNKSIFKIYCKDCSLIFQNFLIDEFMNTKPSEYDIINKSIFDYSGNI